MFFLIIYIIGPMMLVVTLCPIMLLKSIAQVVQTGFSSNGDAKFYIVVTSFFIILSIWIPWTRVFYNRFPWLLGYVKMSFINLVILGIASYILDYGYMVKNSGRHILFFIIMIIQIVVCRLVFSLYFNKNKIGPMEG